MDHKSFRVHPSLGSLNPFWGFGGAKAKEKHCVLATNTTTDTTQAMPAERRLENISSKLLNVPLWEFTFLKSEIRNKRSFEILSKYC